MAKPSLNLKSVWTRISASDRDPSKRAANPYRDWLIMLSTFAVSMAIAIGLGTYEFFLVNETSRPASATVDHTVSIDLQSIDAVLASYDAREQNFEALMSSGTSSAADPSI